MSNPSERAQRRRATWSGGIAKDHQELERIDAEQSRELSPAARLALIWSLIEDSLALEGYDGPPLRLERSVFGIRPLRG